MPFELQPDLHGRLGVARPLREDDHAADLAGRHSGGRYNDERKALKLPVRSGRRNPRTDQARCAFEITDAALAEQQCNRQGGGA